MFLTKVVLRSYYNQLFWKEKFILGSPKHSKKIFGLRSWNNLVEKFPMIS